MTNGLVYVMPSLGEGPRPMADDDDEAWQSWPDIYQKVYNVINRFIGDYHPNYYRACLKALSGIPGVASVEDLDPNPPDYDAPQFDEKGNPIIY
jgi:hypothetical protein